LMDMPIMNMVERREREGEIEAEPAKVKQNGYHGAYM
jgi:hypothetical protein